MGGGTTMAVADKLHRRWIGIDQSVMAVKVTEQRLQKQGGRFETIITKTADVRSCRPQTVSAKYGKISRETPQPFAR
jgi:DNA modification methylase